MRLVHYYDMMVWASRAVRYHMMHHSTVLLDTIHVSICAGEWRSCCSFTSTTLLQRLHHYRKTGATHGFCL